MRALLLLTPLLALAACGGGDDAPAPLAGTPCATLTAEAFQQRGVTLKHSASMNEVAIKRQFGNAKCGGATSGNATRGGSTCELSSPGLVQVTADGADTYFDIPVGEPATIDVSGGQVRCVLTREQKQ
jgi:hypothetical protein